MRNSITIKRSSLLYDIANLAFVVGDVASDLKSPHSLHQIFDICAPGNIDRVDRLLDLAFAEVRTILRKIIDGRCCRGYDRRDESGECGTTGNENCRDFRLILKSGIINCEWECRLQETIREYMTAKVMAGWLSVTLPEAADVWKEKAEDMKTALSASIFSASVTTRRVPPI